MTILKEIWDFHWLSHIQLRRMDSLFLRAGMNIKYSGDSRMSEMVIRHKNQCLVFVSIAYTRIME